MELSITPARRVAEPVTFTWRRGDEDDAGAAADRRARADVRLEVFVGEQAVPFVLEIDARDGLGTTVHVLGRGADGTPLAAARLLTDPDHPGEVHLGRLAVRALARGTGLGARTVRAVEHAALEHARTQGWEHLRVVLSAQEQAMGFYARLGYEVVSGQRYLDAGIWHQDMARELSVPAGS